MRFFIAYIISAAFPRIVDNGHLRPLVSIKQRQFYRWRACPAASPSPLCVTRIFEIIFLQPRRILARLSLPRKPSETRCGNDNNIIIITARRTKLIVLGKNVRNDNSHRICTIDGCVLFKVFESFHKSVFDWNIIRRHKLIFLLSQYLRPNTSLLKSF